jgi:hypothetical protein
MFTNSNKQVKSNNMSNIFSNSNNQVKLRNSNMSNMFSNLKSIKFLNFIDETE